MPFWPCSFMEAGGQDVKGAGANCSSKPAGRDFLCFSSQSSLTRWKHDRKLLLYFQNAEQSTMLCLPNYSSWLRGWEKERKVTFVFFQLLWWRKTITQRNDCSRKAEFPWSQGFTRSRKKQQEALYAFHSFYEPNLVLCFLCPELPPNCRSPKYRFCITRPALRKASSCTYWRPS